MSILLTVKAVKCFVNFSVERMQMATLLVFKAQYPISFMENFTRNWFVNLSDRFTLKSKCVCCVCVCCTALNGKEEKNKSKSKKQKKKKKVINTTAKISSQWLESNSHHVPLSLWWFLWLSPGFSTPTGSSCSLEFGNIKTISQ